MFFFYSSGCGVGWGVFSLVRLTVQTDVLLLFFFFGSLFFVHTKFLLLSATAELTDPFSAEDALYP